MHGLLISMYVPGAQKSCKTAGAGVCWDVGLGAVAMYKVQGAQ